MKIMGLLITGYPLYKTNVSDISAEQTWNGRQSTWWWPQQRLYHRWICIYIQNVYFHTSFSQSTCSSIPTTLASLATTQLKYHYAIL